MKDGTFPIGRLLGIQVRLHPSWIFIFALVVIQLALVGAPGDEQQLSTSVRWILAVIVALLFFASVLFHELAHAIVARRHGITVKSVTLFIFGGAAALEQEAPNPRVEALVALAGPLTNLVLVPLFLVPWLVTRDASNELVRAAGVLSFWLAVSNLILGVFNLVPGFPMDGGRVLRAILWRRSGDFMRATRAAARIGRVFALLLIGGGFLMAIVEDLVLGVWLIFIGWFLSQAAEGSYRRVAVERLLEGLHVADAMVHDYPVVSPNLTLDTLAQQAELGGGESFYPVVHDGALAGAIDLAALRRVPREQWPTTRVTDVMRRGDALATLTEQDSLWDAVLRFDETRSEGLPVVDSQDRGRLVGLVTRESVFRALRLRRGESPAAPGAAAQGGMP
jgi:Zn-dependent protease